MTSQNETLNDEQLKQARKEAGGFCFCIWMVTATKMGNPKRDADGISIKDAYEDSITTQVMIEAEKFSDAKAFGMRLSGVSEVLIERVATEADPRKFPRWQVRWQGHAAGSNTLHMQARLVESDLIASKWKPVREL